MSIFMMHFKINLMFVEMFEHSSPCSKLYLNFVPSKCCLIVLFDVNILNTFAFLWTQ